MKSIFCLFSIANNYDQPSNNLVAWWENPPTVEQLDKALEEDGTKGNHQLILQLKDGADTCVTDCEIKYGGTSYRIERVLEAA